MTEEDLRKRAYECWENRKNNGYNYVKMMTNFYLSLHPDENKDEVLRKASVFYDENIISVDQQNHYSYIDLMVDFVLSLKKSKKIFSEIDPYGEENWDDGKKIEQKIIHSKQAEINNFLWRPRTHPLL